MPASAHALRSVSEIGREASLMSVSARQNFWKPPPVPEMPTVTRVPGLAFWNSSATASLIGKTVLLPSSVTTAWPPPAAGDEAWDCDEGEPPQAARPSDRATPIEVTRRVEDIIDTTLAPASFGAVSDV